MLKDVSVLIDDANRMRLGDLDMTPDQAVETLVRDEDACAGLEATAMDGRRIGWNRSSGWRQDEVVTWALETSQFDGRRVLCCDSELSGFMGYGRVVASRPSAKGSDDRIVCVFPTQQGAEIESALRPEDIVLLSDLIEAEVEKMDGGMLAVDVTDAVLSLEDEEIMKIHDGAADSLPDGVHDALADAHGEDPSNLQVSIVDAICDYLGATATASGPEGERRVPETVFRQALENTVQCRILREMELTQQLDIRGPGNGAPTA